MKRFVGSLGLITALLISALGASNVSAENTEFVTRPAPDAPVEGTAVPGQYIVVLKEDANLNALLSTLNIKTLFTYTGVLNGFAAQLTDVQLNLLNTNPAVDFIEQDKVVSVSTTQYSAPWGIDRIDQRNRPLSGSYTYYNNGAGVRAYVIDTGIQSNHPQFGGRAISVYNNQGGSADDCNGHGTHVAGSIGGATHGVAKGVMLRGVKVLACDGSGTWSAIIAGMDWVRLNAVKPAVANMSLGGPYSAAVNTAASNLVNAGIFTAVAAGNNNAAACNYSPASAPGTLSVGASSSTDARASFSNYGACVDVYAPGVSVPSTWIGSGYNTISGTSMASPHAAGVGALYKSTYGDASSGTINSWIMNNATVNVISGNISGTPNRLLFKGGF